MKKCLEKLRRQKALMVNLSQKRNLWTSRYNPSKLNYSRINFCIEIDRYPCQNILKILSIHEDNNNSCLNSWYLEWDISVFLASQFNLRQRNISKISQKKSWYRERAQPLCCNSIWQAELLWSRQDKNGKEAWKDTEGKSGKVDRGKWK